MNSIHQGFHVGVAVGKFLGVERPITVVILPAIVQGNPGEAHFLYGWERVVDLFELYRPAITPGTPDRAKGAVGRRSHLESLPHHEAAVFGERAKVIPFMHRDEGAESMKALSWIQRALTGRANRNASVAGVGHGYGKRY